MQKMAESMQNMQELSQTDMPKVEQELGIPVCSIIRLADLIDHLETAGDDEDTLSAINEYRSQYGI